MILCTKKYSRKKKRNMHHKPNSLRVHSNQLRYIALINYKSITIYNIVSCNQLNYKYPLSWFRSWGTFAAAFMIYEIRSIRVAEKSQDPTISIPFSHRWSSIKQRNISSWFSCWLNSSKRSGGTTSPHGQIQYSINYVRYYPHQIPIKSM